MYVVKLFFDECCSPKLPGNIVEAYKDDFPDVQTKHLTEFFKAGTDDSKWVAILEKEKDWIVITADRGKESKKPKLPLICYQQGITHLSMTPALAHDGYSAHKHALFAVWLQIVRVPLIPKGTKISFGYRMTNKGKTRTPFLSIGQVSFDHWCDKNNIPKVG
jgi:hypothetical protein